MYLHQWLVASDNDKYDPGSSSFWLQLFYSLSNNADLIVGSTVAPEILKPADSQYAHKIQSLENKSRF